MKSDISRFNVDCAASTGLYEAAAGAFGDSGAGSDGDVGECPAPSLAPEECAGAVSNCWSPGQRDTGELGRTDWVSQIFLLCSLDCPSNGLCCFDGCADTCVDGPKPTPPPYEPEPLPVEPVEAETEEKPQEVVQPPPPPPVTEGYNYPVPDLPLELPKPSRPPPELPTLYGAPPI